MVPLFKSVGYQLIYHTLSEKFEYIKFKFRLRPSTFYFAPTEIATNMFSRQNNDKIIPKNTKSETKQSNI